MGSGSFCLCFQEFPLNWWVHSNLKSHKRRKDQLHKKVIFSCLFLPLETVTYFVYFDNTLENHVNRDKI